MIKLRFRPALVDALKNYRRDDLVADISAWITVGFVALLTVMMIPIGLPGALEYTMLSLVLFPVTGVAWHRRVRRTMHSIPTTS